MADDSGPDAVTTFFISLAGFLMIAFPLVASANSALLDGRLGTDMVFLFSAILGITPALEFAFSGRDPYLLGQYVVVFVGITFLSVVLNAIVHVAAGYDEPLPIVTFVLLMVSYAAAYVVVYRMRFDYVARLLRP